MITEVIDRVAQWNSNRYSRRYNATLGNELLLEELRELYDAKTKLDILDAVGDITFVAIGNFWKMGIVNRDTMELFSHLEGIKDIGQRNEFINHWVKSISKSNWLTTAITLDMKLNCHAVFITGYIALANINLESQFIRVLDAICTSNETKEVPKELCDPAKKANIVKGKGYLGPSLDLLCIIGEHNG